MEIPDALEACGVLYFVVYKFGLQIYVNCL